jgi:hypothetical protein
MVEIKENGEWEINSGDGLSKLEWYAGMALSGILSNPTFSQCTLKAVAESSFQHAQAMIEEAEKRSKR